MIGLMAVAIPVSAETYYVLPPDSGSDATVDANFSASGYLKLIIFPEDGWLDWLNPRSTAYAGIHLHSTPPSTISGTLQADVVEGELQLSGMDLNLLNDGPQTITAGADIHVDALPAAIRLLLDTFLAQYINQIDPNIIDPNIVWNVIDVLTGGFDYHQTLDGTITALNMTQTAVPASAPIDPNGDYSGMILLANVDSSLLFAGGLPIDLPATPLPFVLHGNYQPLPTGAFTMATDPVSGGVTTPNVVLYDQVVEVPLDANGTLSAKFRVHLQIDDGHANYTLAPHLYATSGFLLTTNWTPIDRGTVEADPPGPKYPPGTEVTLTAHPVPGWVFDHWEGDATGISNPLTITMDTHKSVTAVFAKEFYWVTLSVQGNGFIAFSGEGIYDPATGKTKVRVEVPDSIALTAIPSSGWAFSNWSGDIPAGHETDNPLELAPTAPTSVTAVFTKTGSCGTGLGFPLGIALGGMGLMVAVRRRR